jgi:hypothetical protein
MEKQSKIVNNAVQQGSDDHMAKGKHKAQSIEERIRQRARVIHLAQGGKGHPLTAWLEAEYEIKAILRRQQEDNPEASGK